MDELQIQYNSILAGLITILHKLDGQVVLTEVDLAVDPSLFRVGIAEDKPGEMTFLLIPKEPTDGITIQPAN